MDKSNDSPNSFFVFSLFAGTSATSIGLDKLAFGLISDIRKVLEGGFLFSAHDIHTEDTQMSKLLIRLYKILSDDFVRLHYGDSKATDSGETLNSFLEGLVLLDNPEYAEAHFQYPEACQVRHQN